MRRSSWSLEETWMVSADTVKSPGGKENVFGLEDILGCFFFFFSYFFCSGALNGAQVMITASERCLGSSAETTGQQQGKGAGWRAVCGSGMSWDGPSAKHGEKKYIHENIFTNWRRWMRAERHQRLRLCRQRVQTGKTFSHWSEKIRLWDLNSSLKIWFETGKTIWIIDVRFLFVWMPCVFFPAYFQRAVYWLRATIPTSRFVLPFPCKSQSNSSGVTSFFAFAEYFFFMLTANCFWHGRWLPEPNSLTI